MVILCWICKKWKKKCNYCLQAFWCKMSLRDMAIMEGNAWFHMLCHAYPNSCWDNLLYSSVNARMSVYLFICRHCWPARLLPKTSQTFSMKFRSGECAGKRRCWTYSLSRHSWTATIWHVCVVIHENKFIINSSTEHENMRQQNIMNVLLTSHSPVGSTYRDVQPFIMTPAHTMTLHVGYWSSFCVCQTTCSTTLLPDQMSSTIRETKPTFICE